MQLIKARSQKRAVPENTIPLINIVFLMLIFFLIAGTVAPPVSVELTPPSSEDLPLMAPAGNAVEILGDGTLVHHGEKLSLESILARFPAPLEVGNTADPDAVVHILADKDLPASKLMPVLQALRASGHKAIRLVTVRGGR